jgi:predicted TIM-barrel fold metal-dependent hydrolase
MIVDAHYHLEERIETVDMLIDQMDQHSIDRVALIATMLDPFDAGDEGAAGAAQMREALLGNARDLGLTFYNSMLTDDGDFSLFGDTYRVYATPDNASVARVMQAHPDRFYGWVFVNPSAADPIEETDRWTRLPGWIGVKSHPFWHRYAVAALDDVAAYCSEKNWPLLIHLGGDDERGDYRYLPERHPRLRVLYAHAGVPFYREVWDYAKSSDNVFLDLSSPAYVDQSMRLEIINTVGADKCLYGTDGPYDCPDHGRILEEIRQLPLSDAEKERILGGNFVELANLQQGG